MRLREHSRKRLNKGTHPLPCWEVELPSWFGALNTDFRYQRSPPLELRRLTCTSLSGGKVSWQVTGIRHDPYAKAHGIRVEVEKEDDERGTYLYPEGYGKPDTKGKDYAMKLRLEATAASVLPSRNLPKAPEHI